MLVHRIGLACAVTAAGAALLTSCGDAAPPPASAADAALQAQHAMHGGVANVASTSLDPFTYRATMDPYRIQALPDFMVQSKARSDIVFQRNVFAPGAGPWHTHPGPSFVYVVQGQIKLERYSRKDGCTETPVHSPGAVYTEVADEVHRAVVVGTEPAVVLVTRFDIPVGAPITIPAADPGC